MPERILLEVTRRYETSLTTIPWAQEVAHWLLEDYPSPDLVGFHQDIETPYWMEDLVAILNLDDRESCTNLDILILDWDRVLFELNELDPDDPLLEIMPNTKRLKETLRTNSLPQLENFNSFSGLKRIVSAIPTIDQEALLNRSSRLSVEELHARSSREVSRDRISEFLGAIAVGYVVASVVSHQMKSDPESPIEISPEIIIEALGETIYLMRYHGTDSNLEMLISRNIPYLDPPSQWLTFAEYQDFEREAAAIEQKVAEEQARRRLQEELQLRLPDM